MRAISKGIVSERDRLLSYNIAEYYNEMSLFIEETEVQKKEAAKKK